MCVVVVVYVRSDVASIGAFFLYFHYMFYNSSCQRGHHVVKQQKEKNYPFTTLIYLSANSKSDKNISNNIF